MAGLGTFLVALTAPVVKRAMVALGFGVVSYAAVSAALTAVLGHAKSAWANLGGDLLSLIELAGASTCMSIIAGALVARVSLQLVKRFELK